MRLSKKGDGVKGRYVLGDQLGSGNFAVVKKAKFKSGLSDEQRKFGDTVYDTNQAFAVKIIDKAKVEDMGDIEREISIMQDVDHPNVIKLFEIFDETKKMNLVMELVLGGELFDAIVSRGNYTEKDAAVVMKTLCDALRYLHDKKIVHRDLKPENILLESEASDAKIKIADFGLARVMTNKDVMKTACGTPGYVAPEVLQNKGYQGGGLDIWSAGVVLYILLCGFPPFYEEELPALFDQIIKGKYDFPSPWWDAISSTAKDLVKKCLTVDVSKRFTAQQVLEHEWIVKLQGASDKAIDIGQLKKYQATRKLKKAAAKILAMQRIKNLSMAAAATS